MQEEPLMAKAEVIISTPTADTLFVNGKIVTVNSCDQIVGALSIRGNRIFTRRESALRRTNRRSNTKLST
jgi:predicted amidohydrolase YtcJ